MIARRLAATAAALALTLAGSLVASAPATAAVSDRCRGNGPGVNLSGCEITNRNLFNANLNGADLSNATLRNVDLQQASLNGANLTGARLIDTNLRNARLQDANLTRASFESTSSRPVSCALDRNPFRGADFRRARMSRVRYGFPVAGANFGQADLSNSVLPCMFGVTAIQADVRAAALSEIRDSDFSRANFTGATLVGSGFFRSTLSAANFSGTSISVKPEYYGPEGPQDRTNGVFDRACQFGCGNADRETGQFDERRFHAVYQCSFCQSDLSGATFDGATFTGAVFRDVVLRHARGVGIRLRTRTDTLREHVTNTPANVFEVTVLHYSDSVLGLGRRVGGGPGVNVRSSGYTIDNGLLVGPEVNLTGVDLRSRSFLPDTLKGARLTGADLRGATLRGSIQGARVEGAKLAGSTLSGMSSGGLIGTPASLPAGFKVTSGFLLGPGVSFREANLRTVNFGVVSLRGADFTGANLSDALLGAAVIDGAKVVGLSGGAPRSLPVGTIFRRVRSCLVENRVVGSCATLIGPGISLARADLSGVDFSGAHLLGANLTEANVVAADFSRATMDGVISGRMVGPPARLPNPWRFAGGALLGPSAVARGANLEGAQLAGADLTRADLSRSRLTGANLSGATLVRTDLRDTSLVNADLRAANMTLATIRDAFASGADLRGANVAGADLRLLPGTVFQAMEPDPAGLKVGDRGVLGTPRALPERYRKIGPYLVGPFADLRGADLRGLDLRTADPLAFHSMKTGRNLTGTIVVDGLTRTTQVSSGFKFVNRTLAGPQLNLVGADLSGADLRGVSFAGSRLRGVNFRLSDLSRADLTGASGGGALLQSEALGGQFSEQPVPVSGVPLLLPRGWTTTSTVGGSALISVPQGPRATKATLSPASRGITARLTLNCNVVTPASPKPGQQVLCAPGEGGAPVTEVVFTATPVTGPVVRTRCPMTSPNGSASTVRVSSCTIGVLKPGVSYRVSATAVNAVGESPTTVLASSVVAGD